MRRNHNSGGPWEATFGYSRAVRINDTIAVSGTTAAEPDGTFLAPHDAAAQAGRAFELIDEALQALGASLHDVIRVRMFLRDIADLPAVGAVFTGVFANIAPAATALAVSHFIADEALVEIEVDAVVSAQARK